MTAPHRIDPGDRAVAAVPIALQLVGAVRESAPAVAAWMRQQTPADLQAVAVVLAALVPDDRTPRELLAWLEPLPVRHRPTYGRPLRPCGTHAAHERHRARGEDIDPACREAERVYQQDRHARRRLALVQSGATS